MQGDIGQNELLTTEKNKQEEESEKQSNGRMSR
jgi:hypothetical protein